MSPFWWNVVWFFCGAGTALAVYGLGCWSLFYIYCRDLEEEEFERFAGKPSSTTKPNNIERLA